MSLINVARVSLLTAVIWPFGHKHNQTPPPLPPVVIQQLPPSNEIIVPEKICEHDPSVGWFITGPDGAVGFSTESCQKAFEDWKRQPANPWHPNRS